MNLRVSFDWFWFKTWQFELEATTAPINMRAISCSIFEPSMWSTKQYVLTSPWLESLNYANDSLCNVLFFLITFSHVWILFYYVVNCFDIFLSYDCFSSGLWPPWGLLEPMNKSSFFLKELAVSGIKKYLWAKLNYYRKGG